VRVVAVDPGKTTGVAVWTGGLGAVSCQFEDKHEFYQWAELHVTTQTTFVVENFVPRKGALTWVPDSLHIIGWIEGRVWQWGYPKFVLQSPAQAKSFATDDKLRRLGWWVPGQDHARDALRHLVVFLCTTAEGRALGGDEVLKKLVEEQYREQNPP
jgi:hypothetical protein